MLVSNQTFPKNRTHEIQESIERIQEICEAFLLPQEIVSANLKDMYKGLSDKSFWIALSDIHSITKGKLKDWKPEDDKLECVSKSRKTE
jgi:hypothetical protein